MIFIIIFILVHIIDSRMCVCCGGFAWYATVVWWRLGRNEASLSQMDLGVKAEDLLDSQADAPKPGGPYKDILHLIVPQVIWTVYLLVHSYILYSM